VEDEKKKKIRKEQIKKEINKKKKYDEMRSEMFEMEIEM
jgi:hypothetical protein